MNTNELPLIQNADLKGKIVLVRVDHNVVKNGIIQDAYRIDSTIGTLFNINARGGKIILMTHVGRPRNKKENTVEISAKSSVEPIVEYLKNKLNINFQIPNFKIQTEEGYLGVETSVNHLIKELKEGEIDGIYLPNTRWFRGEERKEFADDFANQLAGLADIYVNDAFGSWQAHASTVAVSNYLPSYAGFLMQKELENLDRIYNAKQPYIAVVAGSKFDTKIEPLYTLIKQADFLVLGGVIYNAYLCAKYNIKIKGIGDDDLKLAKEFVDFAKSYPNKIVELPIIVESDTLEGEFEGKFRKHNIKDLKQGTELNYILDVAEESFDIPEIKDIFNKAKTVFVNAVMGLTPHFSEGTSSLYKLIDENKESMKLYGGGDTMQELKQLLPGLYITAIDNPNYYLFTGGGAVLKAIQEGSYKGLEPVKALFNNAKN